MTTVTTTTTTSPAATVSAATTTVVIDLPFVEYLKIEYGETEQILRHYSTVRLLGSTFLFGLAFAVLKDKWPENKQTFFWLRSAASFWMISLIYLYVFTLLERREFAYAKEIREKIRKKTVLLAGGAAVPPPATTDEYPKREEIGLGFLLRFWKVRKDAPLIIALLSTVLFVLLTAAAVGRQFPAADWKSVLNPFGP